MALLTENLKGQGAMKISGKGTNSELQRLYHTGVFRLNGIGRFFTSTGGLRPAARWYVLLIMLCFALPCVAQFSANVEGTVMDKAGAVIPNVTITLHNTETGVDLLQTTNGSGFYRFSSVAPGDYTVRAVFAGFETSTVSAQVGTQQTRGVDITLMPAGANVNVTVNSVASALNPEETRLAATLSSQEISQLPLPNRDVQLLLALTPGVVGFQNETINGGYGATIFAASFHPPYSANGQGTQSNLYLVDDLPVSDDMTQGAALILPNAEMIDEVALQTQTYSVENSTGASLQTSFTTKSGTNGFHGTLDYSYAGNNLAAATQPTHVGGQPVASFGTEFHQDLLLGSLGGPIVKDRTFFFGSVEKQNAAIGTASGTNPYFTPSFATWAVQAFPNSPMAYALNWAPPTRDIGGTTKTAADYGMACGVDKTVPANPSLTYNIPCDQSVYTVGATFNQSQPFDGLQWNIRLDQNFRGGKDRVYLMYERIDQKLGNLSERPMLDAVTPSQNKYLSLNYIHLFSPRLLNEAHVGNLRAIVGSQLKNPASASIPFQEEGLDTAAGYQFEFPLPTPAGAQTGKEHTYAVRDTVSYTIRNHSIRAGYQFYRGDAFQDSSSYYSRPFVPFFFTDTFSWVSNSYKAGYSLYTIGGDGKFTPQYYGASSSFNGLFVEDSWKLRPNLTVTAGLRYDDFGNPTKYGSTAQPFAPMFPGAGADFSQQAWATTTHIAKTAFTESQNWNFMPRVGLAYSPMKNNPLLLRGGIGLYENAMTSFQIAQNLPTQPPNRISLYTTSVVPFGDFKTTGPPYGYNYGTFPVFGTDPSGNIYSSDPALATPEHPATVYAADLNGLVPTIKPEKYLNYSFGAEQQFPARVILGVTYVGSHGYDLVYGSTSAGGGSNNDYNLAPNSPTARPTSEWGKLNYGRNGLSSNYNAMVVTVKQSYRQLTYQANYNWSKALQYAPTFADLTQGTSFSIWKGIYDPKSYYGPTSFDRTNTFSLGGTYELPKISKSYLVNEAASGWRLGTIIIAQSGTPFTVDETGVDYQNDGSFARDGAGGGTPGFPTYLGSKRKGFSRTEALAGVFGQSTTALKLFADPAGLGLGPVTSSQGANSFRNLGYFNVDATVSKGFTVPLPGRPDGGKLYLRGEAVNLLNRTNWQSIDGGYAAGTTGIAPANFGTVTSANQKRYLQIGGRFEF